MKKKTLKWVYRLLAFVVVVYLLALNNKGDIEYIYANF